MEKKTIEITNPNGLHLRVASEVVKICNEHKSKVVLSCKDCAEAEGCSVLSLLMLGAKKGDTITISAEGADAKEVISAISSYFSDGAGI
ncbi:MAG: HPr family phosphocarrier protein [Elusimicrobia bacterium]|nr:HPr family phosphocarrier protein [Candidatus Liberimonas magnetica]